MGLQKLMIIINQLIAKNCLVYHLSAHFRPVFHFCASCMLLALHFVSPLDRTTISQSILIYWVPAAKRLGAVE